VVSEVAGSREEALRRLRDPVRNEGKFACLSCGWSKTLRFDEEEIKALDGNISGYAGPCPDCNAMTLMDRDML
jgi:hypothetical protein